MVESAKWGVLYCPKGMYGTRQRWKEIAACLKTHQIDFDFIQSEETGSVERLVRMLVNNGYKTIVIVGGDSALNDAVNCLMQVDSSVRDTISLGVIPNGIMNDFACFWDLRENELDHIVQSLKLHRVRKIDLGCIRYTNRRGESCHRYFLNCVNLGLVASIMNLRRKTHHFFGSRMLSFLSSFLLMIFQRLDYKMELYINGEVIKRRVMTVCVGNASGYGQTPNAVPYNGLLDVSVVYHPKMVQLFEGFYLFVKGKFLNHRNVHPYRTREVEVKDLGHALVGVDGRLINTPIGALKITVEQEVINFLIPS